MTKQQNEQKLDKELLIKPVIGGIVSTVIVSLIYFIAVWNVSITGLLFYGISLICFIISHLILIKYNPEVLIERAKKRDNTKDWTKFFFHYFS